MKLEEVRFSSFVELIHYFEELFERYKSWYVEVLADSKKHKFNVIKNTNKLLKIIRKEINKYEDILQGEKYWWINIYTTILEDELHIKTMLKFLVYGDSGRVDVFFSWIKRIENLFIKYIEIFDCDRRFLIKLNLSNMNAKIIFKDVGYV